MARRFFAADNALRCDCGFEDLAQLLRAELLPFEAIAVRVRPHDAGGEPFETTPCCACGALDLDTNAGEGSQSGLGL